MSFKKRLNKVIPGGAHTYSRGHDQFPSNAPEILSKGKGAYVFDDHNSKYLDYGMGLRSVILGYSDEEVNQAAFSQIENGNNLTRASLIELQAAELFVDLIDSVDMVKFTKNGSTAVSAAVKLARAYTGRNLVARCSQQPFFSFDDWFIGSTPLTRGIPQSTIDMTKAFDFNDINSLQALIEQYPNEISCVVLEPASTECPASSKNPTGKCLCSSDGAKQIYQNGKCNLDISTERNFLKEVQDLCTKNGIVFILDEMITGFRWHIKGAQHLYGVTPDLCTFGKAMANGFSVSCVAGKKEIMELGSILEKGQERLFLLSTTHGAEMSGLGAFVKTIEIMQRESAIEYLWEYGAQLQNMTLELSREFGLEKNFTIGGPSCSPFYLTLDENGINSLELRTLFVQEMMKNKVMMPWIALSWKHGAKELALTEEAMHNSFKILKKAVEQGVDKYLEGDVIKPVFRKYN